MARVSRDPFAREEIHREPITGFCNWCGGTNGRGKVYRYRLESDGGRVSEMPGQYCSESCRKSYQS